MDKVKHKILIIDDDEFLLDMYAVKFKEEGFEVETARGGKEASDKIKGGASPEVVLLDVVMPGMDGFELLETIRKENLIPAAKIIILAAGIRFSFLIVSKSSKPSIPGITTSSKTTSGEAPPLILSEASFPPRAVSTSNPSSLNLTAYISSRNSSSSIIKILCLTL